MTPEQPKKQPKKQTKPKKKKLAPLRKKAEPTKKTGKKKNIVSDSTLQAGLAVEAHRVRATLREISNRFVSNIEAELVRSIEMISEVADGARKKAEIKKMVTSLQALDIKRDKGRLGDLKRIRDLVKQINTTLEEML